MAEENVEILRRIYADWAEGNFASGTELYDEHLVLVLRPEFMDAGAYSGMREMQRYMRAFLEGWEVVTIEATHLRAAGDTVLARVMQRGTGVSSRAPVEQPYYQLWTFRGGKVIRIESIIDEPEALQAAGLA